MTIIFILSPDFLIFANKIYKSLFFSSYYKNFYLYYYFWSNLI